MRIAFETRFREKKKKRNKGRELRGDRLMAVCNSHRSHSPLNAVFPVFGIFPAMHANFSLNLSRSEHSRTLVFLSWKNFLPVYLCSVFTYLLLLDLFFFSPFNYGNFIENLAREKFVSIFLTGGEKKRRKIVGEIYLKTSPIRNRHDTYKSNYNFTVNYL